MDGKEQIITADCYSAKNPIAQLRPSHYRVFTLTEVKIIVFSQAILDHVLSMGEPEEIDVDDFIVEESKYGHAYVEDNVHQKTYDKVFFDLLSLLHTNKLDLPSLPDVALKIRRAIEDENSDADEVVKIINMDQSLVIKILQTANSVIYNTSGKRIESSKVACTRIGSEKLSNIVMSHSMKSLFKTDVDVLKSKMKSAWQRSIKIAAISSVLARLTPGFDPEKALLAGLLINIGSVAVLNNLGNSPEVIKDQKLLDSIVFDLQSEVGEALLVKWDFPEELIEVVKHSTDWFKDDSEKPDYSDIINIAQLHAYLGSSFQDKLPKINEVPAFNKLALGKLSPEMSLQILDKSQEEIEQISALFD